MLVRVIGRELIGTGFACRRRPLRGLDKSRQTRSHPRRHRMLVMALTWPNRV
jgi:hypothetical protein